MSPNFPYQDASRPIPERVEDLLGRMTLAEKAGQMCQMNGRDGAEAILTEHHVGSFLHMLGEETNAIQRLAAETRLGIPVLFGIDAIHGHGFWPTSTIFPTQLALSCTWNPALVEEVGRITAREVAYTGVHWTFSPVLGTVRDLRWGRVGETFGEDPYLIGVLGSAIVRGYQGDDLSHPETIAACGKHYAGYSGTQGGRDSSEADLSERAMRSIYLRPFRAVVEAGCATLMAGYHAIDGTPCSANRWLLTEVLRDEWGFAGFVVSDWKNVEHMNDEQRVSPDLADAARRIVAAGNDMAMNTPGFTDLVIRLVEEGDLDEALVDQAVRNILRVKFALGLFDGNRYADLEQGAAVIGCAAHRAVALESAVQSLVLLKNEGALLPLGDDVQRIAVIGPNADDLQAQLGDWVLWSGQLGDADLPGRARESVVTLLDGIRTRAGAGCTVEYARGCDVIDPGTDEIAAAAELARAADVAVVVVGDTLALTGECHDRANLDLSGGQQALLEAVHATGTPMVVVLLSSKPLTIPWVAAHARALLAVWNPGLEGGTAVASILFGDRNPSGKLTVSIPYHVGQQPVYYNVLPGWHGAPKYVDLPYEPLFPFGYGLSYTRFAYSNLRLSAGELAEGEMLQVMVDVENVGDRAGVEVVQLYVNDLFSSVATPLKELKGFARVELAPGEKQTVELALAYDQLALVNADVETVVEPGAFEVLVGGSSRDEDVLKARFVVNDK
ncbi:MAG: glycoside hydrolase family 3 C-terminal domain-containing protein [Anaerolineae bacterium]|nr:glycoside hydrolase family 3 C-terminal domain-containing protein [Anaerolineae bacterium]